MTDAAMTRAEREDLQRLVRQREKVQVAAAKQRSAELMADFENQMASEFSFDDDAVWAEAVRAVEPEVEKAQARIAERCRVLGIPKQFAPKLRLNWHARGYENAVKERRDELRRVAKTQIEAIERAAIVSIQQTSVEAQTRLAMAGLTSQAAIAFMESLPSVESLMPGLSYQELAGEADPPIVETLITPNALRQRRFRERQKALRNTSVTPQLPLRDDREENDQKSSTA